MIIIDRFEGDFAVLETENGMENVPRAELPENSREGDAVFFDGEKWCIDAQSTEERRQAVSSKLQSLLKK